MARKDKDHNKDTFQKVIRGLAQRTPSAAERAKDAAREAIVEKERQRIQKESRRIAALIAAKEEADRIHKAAEAERRKNK